jgi:hypothetical protein
MTSLRFSHGLVVVGSCFSLVPPWSSCCVRFIELAAAIPEGKTGEETSAEVSSARKSKETRAELSGKKGKEATAVATKTQWPLLTTIYLSDLSESCIGTGSSIIL